MLTHPYSLSKKSTNVSHKFHGCSPSCFLPLHNHTILILNLRRPLICVNCISPMLQRVQPRPLCIVFNVRFCTSKLIIKSENFMIFEFMGEEKLEVTTMLKNLTFFSPSPMTIKIHFNMCYLKNLTKATSTQRRRII